MAEVKVKIGPVTAIILRAMLANLKQARYSDSLAEETGQVRPSVRHALRRLEDIGWCVSTVSGKSGPRGGPPCRFYNLTGYGIKMAREEVKEWTFTDS